MIKKIKIYGERNSGTNFLQKLIEKNINNIELHPFVYNNKTGWKHSYPRLELFKNEINTTLFIFIIRDLNPWLKSMYLNPYSIKKINDKNLFLTSKIKSDDVRKDHDVNIIKGETNIDIFQLRYNKIASYIKTFSKIKYGIFVNLENIQNDYGKKFINTLSNNFKLSKNQNFNIISKHTKTNKKYQNNENNIKFNEKIINRKKSITYEYFNKSLKKNYVVKLGL